MSNFNKYELQRICKKLMLTKYPHGVWDILSDDTKREYYMQAECAVEEVVQILTERGEVKDGE